MKNNSVKIKLSLRPIAMMYKFWGKITKYCLLAEMRISMYVIILDTTSLYIIFIKSYRKLCSEIILGIFLQTIQLNIIVIILVKDTIITINIRH